MCNFKCTVEGQIKKGQKTHTQKKKKKKNERLNKAL
jgi:hypothetical protein